MYAAKYVLLDNVYRSSTVCYVTTLSWLRVSIMMSKARLAFKFFMHMNYQQIIQIISVNRYGFKIAAQNVGNTNLNTTSLCLHQWEGNIHLLQSTMEFLMENRIQEAQWVRIRGQRNTFLYLMYGISSKLSCKDIAYQ